MNCEICGINFIRKSDYKRHLKSQKHLKNSMNKPSELETIKEQEIEDDYEYTETEEDVSDTTPFNDDNDMLLQELENDKFIDEEEVKEEKPKDDVFKEAINNIKLQKEQVKLESLRNKVSKEKKKEQDDLFDEKGSEILGKDKRALLSKIKQFKILFPKELKDFKVKKNASVKELQDYLNEIDSILELDSINSFIIEPLFSTIQVAENIISNTVKIIDLRGLSNALRMNPEFMKLLKQLSLKYGSIFNAPPEYRIIIIVFTTAVLINQKNKNKEKFNNYLSEPVNIDTNNINIHL